jgi:hypothetical protein
MAIIRKDRRLQMKQIITGQVLLILCCAVYLVWWYRGFRPGIHVSRVGGVNVALLLVTAVLGFAGMIFSLMPVEEIRKPLISQGMIVIFGIAAYLVLLFVTKRLFDRIVTTELFLIVGWTMLEIIAADRLYAVGALDGDGIIVITVIIAAAFLIGIVLYVAYYRMEEMRAFYAAMVPLIVDAVAMAAIIGIVLSN